MNIQSLKQGFSKLKDKANHIVLAASVSLVSAPAFADYNVTELVKEFDEGEEPVAAMASASIELLIVRRIWKIIQRSI